MAIVNDSLKLVTLPVITMGASGVIGPASTTVDIASSFTVNSTVANIAVTLPTPTASTIEGDIVRVYAAIGSQPFTFYGTLVKAGTFGFVNWVDGNWRPVISREPRIAPAPVVGPLAPGGTISATATNTVSVAYTSAEEVFVRFRWNGSINAGAWATWVLPNIAGYTMIQNSLNFYYPNGIPDVAANVAQMDGGASYGGGSTIYRNHATARASVYLDVYATYVRL